MTLGTSIQLAPRSEQIATVTKQFGLGADSAANAGEVQEGFLRSSQYEPAATLTFGPNEDAVTAKEWPYLIEVSYENERHGGAVVDEITGWLDGERIPNRLA